MNVILLANGSSKIGMGHLNRCGVLAKALIRHGCGAMLQVERDFDAEVFLEEKRIPYRWADEDKMIFAALCIVDLYRYDAEFYRALKARYAAIVVFDDCEFSIPEYVDGVINHNLYASNSDYGDCVYSFTGAKYFLLREEFIGQRQGRDADRILITMGGSDPEGQSLRIAKIIREFTDDPIDLVFGLKSDADAFRSAPVSLKNISVYDSVVRMSERMKIARYCVCGAGSTVYELLYMGVPFACLALSENQWLIAAGLEKEKAALCLGYFSEIGDAEISVQLNKFHFELRKRDARANLNIIDGQGAERLARDVLEWLRHEQSRSVL